jgi:hypothetical protein
MLSISATAAYQQQQQHHSVMNQQQMPAQLSAKHIVVRLEYCAKKCH